MGSPMEELEKGLKGFVTLQNNNNINQPDPPHTHTELPETKPPTKE